MEMDCSSSSCLTDPDLLTRLAVRPGLGWVGTNYSQFWARTLQDGLKGRLGARWPTGQGGQHENISGPEGTWYKYFHLYLRGILRHKNVKKCQHSTNMLRVFWSDLSMWGLLVTKSCQLNTLKCSHLSQEFRSEVIRGESARISPSFLWARSVWCLWPCDCWVWWSMIDEWYLYNIRI